MSLEEEREKFPSPRVQRGCEHISGWSSSRVSEVLYEGAKDEWEGGVSLECFDCHSKHRVLRNLNDEVQSFNAGFVVRSPDGMASIQLMSDAYGWVLVGMPACQPIRLTNEHLPLLQKLFTAALVNGKP